MSHRIHIQGMSPRCEYGYRIINTWNGHERKAYCRLGAVRAAIEMHADDPAARLDVDPEWIAAERRSRYDD